MTINVLMCCPSDQKSVHDQQSVCARLDTLTSSLVLTTTWPQSMYGQVNVHVWSSKCACRA